MVRIGLNLNNPLRLSKQERELGVSAKFPLLLPHFLNFLKLLIEGLLIMILASWANVMKYTMLLDKS